MITSRDAKIEKLRRMAQHDMLAFLRYVWWMPGPLHIGRHTRALCDRLTRAVDDYMRGKSTLLIVSMPFRHGKSDLVSKALTPYFIGRCASQPDPAYQQPSVILSGYGSSLVKDFSVKAREIVASDPYRQVFPIVELDPNKQAEDKWRIKNSQSVVQAQGLGGSVTGKGGNLIIVDDYCKNREEAESPTIRDKMYNSFKDDLSTRTNAPAHIIIVCATRWHEDDIIGRLVKRMETDPNAPQWEQLVFPAHKDGPDGWDTLFPEHYDKAWYDFQRNNLDAYSAAALLDCDPKSAGDRYFDCSKILRYSARPDLSRLKINIFVDGAKAKGSSSDYTTMMVIGKSADGCHYLLDGVHARLNLPEKIAALFDLKRQYNPRCVWWEQVGAMSDVESVHMEMDRTMERFMCRELKHTNNKDYRIRRLTYPIEHGLLCIPTHLLKERTLPNGKTQPYDFVKELIEDEMEPYCGPETTDHDDMVDCLADICDEEVMKDFTAPSGGGMNAAPRQATMGRYKGRFG